MTERKSWKILSEGSRDDLVLAFDFPGVGRTEAGFTDLVSRLDTSELTVWESITPSGAAAVGMSGDDYVDLWAEEVRAAGRPVRALLGYCVGSVFASAMGARIGQWQEQAPQIIVFDPESPSVPSMYGNFYTSINMVGSALSKEEVETAHQAGLVAANEGGDDLRTVGTALATIFEATARTAFDRLGLDPQLRDELSQIFGSFTAYLVAAQQIDPVAGLALATAITSSGSSSGAGWAAREIKFELSHEDLLRNDDVAKAVSEALDQTSGRTADQPAG